MAVLDIPVHEAIEAAERALRAAGTPDDIARSVARSLVLAMQVGHDSHGIVRLREYLQFVEQGRVVPDARPEVISRRGGSIVIDGNHGWGQLACHFAVTELRAAAKEFGVAAATVRNCNHVGRIGEYVHALADAGLPAMMWCNADPCVAPFGGKERRLGTNPFAAGIPSSEEAVVVDFATAATAEGKLRVARATGATVEPGLLIDPDGAGSTDPEDFYRGGALLPFGGHKGYGLSLFIELMGGALSGNHPSVTSGYVTGNGVVMVAFDPGFFVEEEAFLADTGEAVRAMRETVPVDPARPVLVPGDIEAAVLASRSMALPIAEEIWADVNALLQQKEEER